MKFFLAVSTFLVSSLCLGSVPLMPTPADQAVAQPIAVCTSLFDDLDITEVAIDLNGQLSAQTNPKYLTEEISAYLVYSGVDVNLTDDQLEVSGDLLTFSGILNLNLKLPRQAVTEVDVLGLPFSCDVK